ncbi:MAG: transposase [Methylococcales bacterium]|nr:transposase [Methylococcales bacterium]
MGRPLRLEFSGALYHVTSRGDRQEDIYESVDDRVMFLEVFGEVCKSYNWVCHGYCLMTNHYHILIETPEANLSKGMRQLNGVYSQKFNRAHKRVGHVFQGRYKAILVEKESYLLELTRYIVLNPVRAKMVHFAKEWKWSSYRATINESTLPSWLHTHWILSGFGQTKGIAIDAYKRFVSEGKGQSSPWLNLKNQVFLGSDAFVKQTSRMIDADKDLRDIPASQRRSIPKPLKYYGDNMSDRNTGIISAYKSGGYSMKEIGEYFGLSYSMVSRILKNSRFKT